jgi:hypothetical protein
MTNFSGHFLLLRTEGPVSEHVQVWSPVFLGTQHNNCTLQMWLFMSNMSSATFRIVVNSTTQWIVYEGRGNSHEQWEKFVHKIGPIRQKFNLILEVVPENPAPALVALDNLRLVSCFDGDKRDIPLT